MKLPAGDSRYVHVFHGAGVLKIESRFEPRGADVPVVPRMGLRTELPGSWTHVEWYGRGPHENYWDRKTSAGVGRHRMTVAELVHDYVEPQENGHRTDTRWCAITDGRRRGLWVRGLPVLEFNVWPLPAGGPQRTGAPAGDAGAKHDHRLPRRAPDGRRRRQFVGRADPPRVLHPARLGARAPDAAGGSRFLKPSPVTPPSAPSPPAARSRRRVRECGRSETRPGCPRTQGRCSPCAKRSSSPPRRRRR